MIAMRTIRGLLAVMLVLAAGCATQPAAAPSPTAVPTSVAAPTPAQPTPTAERCRAMAATLTI